jgi:hypothetical protein
MPCFTYGTNDPQYIASYVGQATVELTYAASGTTYSFSQIARLCSIPNNEQIKVWKKATPSSLEVEQVYSDTTFADGYFRIVNDNVILGVAASGQVIIRRATPNSEMFINFTEGAKLSAEQLNLCFAQLLFIAQEKEFIGSTNNHFYPIANSYTAYSAALSYSLNAYVSYPTTITDSQGNPQTITRIYKCIAPTTPGIAPTNGAYWEPVSYTTNGFVIEGAPLSAPVRFDLSNVEVNHGLIWDGGKFSAGYLGGGTLDSLSDVVINTPLDKQLLQYNNSLQVWQNTTLPLKFGTSNSTLFQGKAYYDSTSGDITNQSFVVDGSGTPPISAPATNELSIFKTNTNNWVIPNPPTVYHILKRIIPNEQDPIAFFDDAKNAIDEVAVNLGNPVKVKFFWNLNEGRLSNKFDVSGGNGLDSTVSLHWDKPQELYSITMWDSGGPENLKYHGVTDLSNINRVYKVSPYFHSLVDGATPANNYWYSKIHGYGLVSKGFYLSVPECYTTCLSRIPIFNNTPTTETDHTYTTTTDLGLDDPAGSKRYTKLSEYNGVWKDTYLEGLRDFATASLLKESFAGYSLARQKDYAARFYKSKLIDAVYRGFEDISFKRLELSEAAKSCLWKIPKNIIYYNKYALAFARREDTNSRINSYSEFINDSSDVDSISKNTRFTGIGDLYENRHGISSTSTTQTGSTHGYIAKGNDLWDNWCNDWNSPYNDTYDSFNEADFDWLLADLSSDLLANPILPNMVGSTSFTFEGYGNDIANANNPFHTGTFKNSNLYLPWAYRPNYINETQIGTHLFNLDYNKLFSETHNYIPDPCDEYVFRLVANSTLTPSFKDVASSTIKSAIILEHGFVEQQESSLNTPKTLASSIFSKNKYSEISQSVNKHIDRSKIKVYVQNEHIESFSGGERYVITLCIRVPRLKSIGYSRVYRKFSTSAAFGAATGNNYYYFPEPGGVGQDTDKDSGPWLVEGVLTNGSPTYNNAGGEGSATASITMSQNTMTIGGGGGGGGAPGTIEPKGPYLTSGRSESAVKFSRLGIPSNLWIKLSVLNTNGTTSLINSGGWTVI